MTITRTSDHIKIKGYYGTWYVIDDGFYFRASDHKEEQAYLLEHETYGDETACIIVNKTGEVLLEDVWNGFEDLEEAGWDKILF